MSAGQGEGPKKLVESKHKEGVKLPELHHGELSSFCSSLSHPLVSYICTKFLVAQNVLFVSKDRRRIKACVTLFTW